MNDWHLVVAGVAFWVCAALHFAARREKATPEQLDDPLVRAATCVEALYEGMIGAVSMFVAVALLDQVDTATKALALPTWAKYPAQGFASTAILTLGPMFLGVRPRKAGEFVALAALAAFLGILGAIFYTVSGGAIDAVTSAFHHHLQSVS
jgi:hypothetical protein